MSTANSCKKKTLLTNSADIMRMQHYWLQLYSKNRKDLEMVSRHGLVHRKHLKLVLISYACTEIVSEKISVCKQTCAWCNYSKYFKNWQLKIPWVRMEYKTSLHVHKQNKTIKPFGSFYLEELEVYLIN